MASAGAILCKAALVFGSITSVYVKMADKRTRSYLQTILQYFLLQRKLKQNQFCLSGALGNHNTLADMQVHNFEIVPYIHITPMRSLSYAISDPYIPQHEFIYGLPMLLQRKPINSLPIYPGRPCPLQCLLITSYRLISRSSQRYRNTRLCVKRYSIVVVIMGGAFPWHIRISIVSTWR
jgi:hypothetical protein